MHGEWGSEWWTLEIFEKRKKKKKKRKWLASPVKMPVTLNVGQEDELEFYLRGKKNPFLQLDLKWPCQLREYAIKGQKNIVHLNEIYSLVHDFCYCLISYPTKHTHSNDNRLYYFIFSFYFNTLNESISKSNPRKVTH